MTVLMTIRMLFFSYKEERKKQSTDTSNKDYNKTVSIKIEFI